jgi:hypothetical protein
LALPPAATANIRAASASPHQRGGRTYDLLYQQPTVEGQLQAMLIDDTGVHGTLLLLVRNQRSVGHVILGERRFTVEGTIDGVSVQEITEPPPPEPLLIDETPALDDAPLKALGRSATADNPAILDVLVLYTAAARN